VALSQGDNVPSFGGRKEVVARKLQDPVFKALEAEAPFFMSLETFIKDVLKQYGSPKPPPIAGNADRCDKALLADRGHFLSHCGRYIIKCGSVLVEAERERFRAS